MSYKVPNILKDHNYMEGTWAAPRMAAIIEKTEYKTLENAIRVKQELIDQFEKDFGYHPNMDEFDRNYSYNYGLLTQLKFIYKQQHPDNEENLD